MSTYTLYFTQTLSTSIEVEAASLDEAVEAAYQSDALPPSLCAHCSGWGQPWDQDASGEWELDESTYEVDGETVSVEGAAR